MDGRAFEMFISAYFSLPRTPQLRIVQRERLRKKIYLKFSVSRKFYVDLLDGLLSLGDARFSSRGRKTACLNEKTAARQSARSER